VWVPVIDANRDNLSAHVEALMQLIRKIVDGDADAFAQAQRFMERLEQ